MDKKARYKFIYQSLNASITRAERAIEHLEKTECGMHDIDMLNTAIDTLERLHKQYKRWHDKLKAMEK